MKIRSDRIRSRQSSHIITKMARVTLLVWDSHVSCIPSEMQSQMFTHLKLLVTIIAAIGLPFLFLQVLNQSIRESVEANLSTLILGIILSLVVGERHLQRQMRDGIQQAFSQKVHVRTMFVAQKLLNRIFNRDIFKQNQMK